MNAVQHGITNLVVHAVVLGLLLTVVRRRAESWADYLGFVRPTFRGVGLAVGGFVLYLAIRLIVVVLVDVGSGQDWTPTYASGPVIWPLVVAMCVTGPLVEETTYRGFLFRGIRESRFGVPGAILIPAILWSAGHPGHTMAGYALIAGLGIIFGVVRHVGRSTYLPLGMHVVWNSMATFARLSRAGLLG